MRKALVTAAALGLFCVAGGCVRAGWQPGDGGALRRDLGWSLGACAGSSSLVGYWPFDETSGGQVIDWSGKGNDGTLLGNAARTAGRLGGAIDFDGVDDVVELSGTAGFDFNGGTGSFTLAYWINPASLSSPNTIRPFELAYCPADPAYFYSFVSADGTTGMALHDTLGHYGQLQSAAGALKVVAWTHVAYVVDRPSSSGTVYIDGEALGSLSDMGTVTGTIDCSQATDVETLGGYDIFKFAGRLDDVRLYARALSATEVGDLFRAPTSGCGW